MKLEKITKFMKKKSNFHFLSNKNGRGISIEWNQTHRQGTLHSGYLQTGFLAKIGLTIGTSL